MEIKKIEIALIVHSCDRYQLLYKGFEYFFKKYWSEEINCTKYFATEELEVNFNGFKNIKSGKGEWADRLKYLLNEKISEPYILYLQEDMWLNKKVNPLFLNQLFEIAKSNKWPQIKLHSSDVYKTIPTDIFIENFNVAKLDNQKSDFLMSHQITLWNKAFLIQQLHKKEHPWRNERKGTKRIKKLNPEIYHVDCFAENGHAEINKNKYPNDRSEYKTVSHNGILNENVLDYILQLNKVSSLNSYGMHLAENFKNKVTHDGKPKPKKTDMFKRIKNWIKGK